MSTSSLEGRTVALLRAQGQGGELKSGLEALGARILEVPTIAIAPPEDGEPLARAAREIASFAWVALTSPNAVAATADAVLREHGERARDVLARARVASVGPGTTAAARARGFDVGLEATDAVQEGLARDLTARGLAGVRVLLPHGDQARDVLEKRLAGAGALVTAVTAYRTVEGAGDPAPLLEALAAGSLDAICFTSGSTARQLARRIGEVELRRWLSGRRPLAASIGPIASAALRELGIEPGVEAREHTARGLVAALEAAFPGAG